MHTEDQYRAADLDRARVTVNDAGAADLGPRPWQHVGQPPSDVDLVRFAAWAARDAPTTEPSVVEAGLRLLAPARAEIDQVEVGLLFAARSAGMTWPQIADALTLGTAQAAQQRLTRVAARVSGDGGS
ncbi:hypothetical protein [Georgenia yuyongxinii]|uniref:DNA-binding protein n=1 Tax=Georgenia yuyongxinii TaxID=2589797 RepID=A0A552WXM2_9MICO|nr:hypothetical protein [Georgenia yuyongxinii]TRW47435.1 hypothetical protein FJ693_01140 [Georgenia yuyongxinii]